MKYILLVCFSFLLLSGNSVIAAENEEIEFLLSYVANSDCTFLRNGDAHEAKGAGDHLQMKYNHVRSRINTAEDFINKIASKSSFSGKLYEVSCAGEQMPTKQWLEEALASHRLSGETQEKDNKTEDVE